MPTIGPKPPRGADGSGSDVSYFLYLLGSKDFSIPLGSNFFIIFNNIPRAIRESGVFARYEPGGGKNSIDILKQRALEIIVDKNNAKSNVCWFANGITPPTETVSVKRAGLETDFEEHSAGVLSGVVTKSRKQQEPVSISFLETETSFIDFVVRPWIVLTSHFGLIARNPNSPDNVKTDITAIFYTTNNGINVPRKIFNFYGAAPVSIDTPLSYDYGTNSINTVKTSWAYNYYSISDATGIIQPSTEAPFNYPKAVEVEEPTSLQDITITREPLLSGPFD